MQQTLPSPPVHFTPPPPENVRYKVAEMQPLVGKKGKVNSFVLKHCFQEPDSEQTKILCKICHTTVSAPQGNMTNLFSQVQTQSNT